ncbi:long-chain-fatty-acid--CoA ligase [Alkalihalobacterium bogoriense]|uniref:long-chain-fatty-acid--CoA ligase n=1 Tax=Alkalihalobacterium bogoriense TaxID=246272 RepID=UPI00047CDBBE|nr:long-chain fatty acid--CoA ligase [Alkalihalobacterium bogoriense]
MVVADKVWKTQYPKEIPTTIQYPETSLVSFLEKAYKKNPDQRAILFMGSTLTYKELYESTVKLANGLKDLGLQSGDRVSIMLPNCPQAVISYYAVLMVGGIVVQTNPLYVERELEHQLNDSGATFMIALDWVYPKIEKVKKVSKLKKILITSLKDYLPFPKNLLFPLVAKKNGMNTKVPYSDEILSFTKVMKAGSPTALSIEATPDDVAILQYTGGTTGLAKGVMLTHRNLIVNVVQCNEWLYKSEYGKERVLGIVPFFHVYGMTVVMNSSIYMGSTMILLPKFDPKTSLKTIDKEKPTLFPGAPTMYIGLLNHPDISNYDLSSIKACISGSAPLPIEVQQQFEKITKGVLVEGYGLTETSPVTHCNFVWGGDRVTGSIGVPWPDTDAKIISLDTGEEVESGQVGELIIKGPQVMKGYWNRPEETAHTIQDGWLYTGDMGYMDEKGYFYIVDRKKDMIIAGGFNIYPREIEEVLFEHPAVMECVVIGVPDPYRGETVKAFIVLKEGEQVSEQEFDTYCREKLAAYKVPKKYEFREELPKTMVGKVLRRALREEEKNNQ